MNYKKHYELLIERARNRLLENYTEQHHILPVCMGGTNKKDNLVDLTPEEHYVAHQLLVKMHPNNRKLIYAMNMMTVNGNGQQRSMNKRYGWVKRKHVLICQNRTGTKNSSFGRFWYYDPITLKNIKCLPENIPNGFIRGRSPPPKNTLCEVCEQDTGSNLRRFCNMHRPKPITPTEHGYKMSQDDKNKIRDYCLNRTPKQHPQYGKRWVNNGVVQEMIPKETLTDFLEAGWLRGKLKKRILS